MAEKKCEIEELSETSEVTSIGTIGNYYGGLCVVKDGDDTFWGIENYHGITLIGIPASLYDALIDYEKNREKGVLE